MKIGVITTSRADFGIYVPLLKKIKERGHELLLFVGGMHTSADFGNSYLLIEKEGFTITEKIKGLVGNDSAEGLTQSMAVTLVGFGEIWTKYKSEIDVVFVLGDRFEMFAAASSLIPFNIPIAHLHGGEITLGAIDNKFRHAMSLISDYHFTSHEAHAERVQQMVGNQKHVYNVGALGVENLLSQDLLSAKEFSEKFQFDIEHDFILTTIHPETVSIGKNKEYVDQFLAAVKEFKLPVLCTLPNADTEGKVVRESLLDFEKQYPNKIKCFENLGIRGYLTAMKYCAAMIGNTSSGIIEAASYKKWVLNLGERQKGRFAPGNVKHVKFDKQAILSTLQYVLQNHCSTIVNPYGKGNTAEEIIKILEKEFK